MWCNQIFSLINEDKIKNTIVCDNYEVANQIAKITYGDNAFAVDTTLYPVNIGDNYINGLFYRDGELIERNPTEEERITELNNQLTEAQLALCELYEKMEV